jgi:hypothetical protein
LSLLTALPDAARAHDIAITGIARVFLDEQADGSFSLSVVDAQAPPLFDISRILPERCEGLQPQLYSYRFRCHPTLHVDDRLSFPWALQGIVVLANWHDGTGVSGFFPGDGRFIDVPLSELHAGAASWRSLAGRYLTLGVEHIVFGLDHLLFVLCLLLLLDGLWPFLKTITAFTLGHSLTLACAVLGWFAPAGGLIEALIALSIVFLAREAIVKLRLEAAGRQGLAAGEAGSTLQRRPWLVALVFGFIHGFGFAGALGELGLARADVPAALLFFNLGVEAGQIGFILAVLALRHILAQASRQLLRPAELVSAHALGGIALYWFIERLPAVVA